MKFKKLGLIGFKKSEINFFKKKFKKFNFINITDKNFFKSSSLDINALVVLYEWPVKNTLSQFLSQKYQKFKNLDWLHLSRAGIDECLPYMKNYNFTFTSGKKIQGPNVSEHCLALLLVLTRGLLSLDRNKYFLRPTEIKDKKILITGFGGIGSEIAKKLFAFGAKIDSVNDTKVTSKYVEKNYKLSNLKKIVKNYEIVINALPLTSKTKNLFDKNIFNRMNKKCFFLNISRDQTIKISDLKKVVNEKKFLGIGIDNTGSFKMNKKIIYDSKSNFVLTDHQAGISTNLDRKKKLIFENLKNYYLKKKMNFLVSKEREY
tara:strand:- start:525 stop:1478 length:954 start_codon:yes stop_codon:yes gene_type:complete